jgi:large subunit ribosomal protein L25
MADVLQTKIREEIGSNAVKRTRRAGYVPAVIYGHGKESLSLALPEDQLNAAIRHGSQMVELQGDVADTALIREVQWDPFGTQILHVDLTRVSAAELVEVTLTVELRGEAPGTKEGGIVEQGVHELRVNCPAGSIPEKIEISVNELNVENVIKAGDLDLPEKVTLVDDPETMVVQCQVPAVVEEPEEGEETAAGLAEPEVIGRPEEDEENE